MNLATFIEPGHLGQTSPETPATDPVAVQYDRYVRAARNSMVSSWNEARAAILTHREIRERNNLPSVVRPGEGTSPAVAAGAFSMAEEASILEIAVVVDTLAKICDGVRDGTRKLVYMGPELGMGIETLTTDTLSVQRIAGRPRLVDAAGQQVQPTGSIAELPVGNVGVAPIVWGVVAVAVALALVLSTDEICQTVRTTAQQKTQQTNAEVAKQWASNVAAGTATAAEAIEAAKSVGQASANLQQQFAATESAGRSSPATSAIAKAISTVALVALGLGALYLVAQFISRRPALATARA